MTVRYAVTFDRFFVKVNKKGPVPSHCPELGPCWLWTAATTIYGYGQFFFNGRLEGAHRVSWRLHIGEIPDGRCVLHRCDVPRCVNPAHLFLGTKRDNALDSVRKGRWPHAQPLLHCRYLVTSEQPPLTATGFVKGINESVCAARAVRKAEQAVPHAEWRTVRLDLLHDQIAS